MTRINSTTWQKEGPKQFSLRDVVSPLFRRKKLLISVFLLTLIGVILLGVLIPAPYRSEMSVLVTRERHDPLVTTEATTQLPMSSGADVSLGEITSEAALLQSQDLLQQVVLATGLADQHGFSVWNLLHPHDTQDDRVARAVKQLAKKIKVKNETNSSLIDVSYSSSDPKQSYAVLDALGKFYVEKHVSVHRPPGSYDFFVKETQHSQDELTASEKRLRDFGTKNGVAAPDMVRTDLAQQVALTVGTLHTAQQQAAADEQRIQSDEKQMATTPQRAPTQQASAPADKLLGDLEASLLAAETKRTQLVLKYEPTFPAVVEADQEIAQTKAAIAEAEKTQYMTQTTDRDPTYELLREDLARTQTDMVAQRATAAAAQRSIQSMQAEMVDLDQKSLTQQDLLRDVKANQDNYLLYLGKREQERTTDALDKTGIANVDIAVPPAVPVLPVYSIPIVVLVALGLALFLSLGVVYTVSYLDTSFHTPGQVVDMLGIPVVVAIPKRTA